MTENNNNDDTKTFKVVCSDSGEYFPARTSYVVDVTRDEMGEEFGVLEAAKTRGKRVATLVSGAANIEEAFGSLLTSVQGVVDSIKETIGSGESVTIGDWADLATLFGEVPGIDAGPPVREFTCSVTISATVDLSGHAPEKMDEIAIADRIRNVLSLIHELDFVDDSDNDELFEVEQDSSSVDFEWGSIDVTFND